MWNVCFCLTDVKCAFHLYSSFFGKLPLCSLVTWEQHSKNAVNTIYKEKEPLSIWKVEYVWCLRDVWRRVQYLCNLYETISDKCNILDPCCEMVQRRIVVPLVTNIQTCKYTNIQIYNLQEWRWWLQKLVSSDALLWHLRQSLILKGSRQIGPRQIPWAFFGSKLGLIILVEAN